MNHCAPFRFYTERRLVVLTGRKARNLRELLTHIEQVSGAAIFYHTHHQYLSHHFERPVFFNDFASWTGWALQNRRLAEQLAAVDLLSFTSVRQVREAISGVIRSYLEQGGENRSCPEGEEFHFCESRSLIMPTGIAAHDVAEFFRKLPEVSNVSLFFHFFEARLRLGRPTNDFSQWLAYCGQEALARAVDALDPYMMSLDELRNQIVWLGRRSGFA